MKSSEKKIKVSVCIVTYNQEKYIRQCLQSIVDQETDFLFEVIVGDDCSTDGTSKIVEEFAEKYPALIIPLFHKNNVGATKNYLAVHDAAIGEYIAHMDGDDYALPDKLQLQANYLDKNPECKISWHRMLITNETKAVISNDLINIEKLPENGFKRRELLRFMAVGLHSSKMYRASNKEFEIPPFPIIDTFVNIEQIGEEGTANFIGDRPLGVYRTGIGMASSGNTTTITLQKSFLYFAKKYPEYKREISTASLLLLLAAIKNNRWGNFYLFSFVFLKAFKFHAIYDLWRFREIYPMLRMPKSTRATKS